MTENNGTNPSLASSVQLEFRERTMDGRHSTERLITFGTDQPVILVEFVGEVGKRLERIIIESTGWEPQAMATLFEDLAVALRREPDSVTRRED